MLGLIKKDLFLIKTNLKNFVIIFAIFILMAIQGIYDISFILPIMCTMIFISTFSYDDYNNWNAYAITFKNGRKNVVKSKYLATIIILIITIALTFLTTVIIGLTKENINFNNIYNSLIGSFIAIVIIISIMYPLIFKFGVEKGRISMFIFVFSISIIIGLILKDVDIKNVELFFTNNYIILVTLIPMFLLIISYFISEKIYITKEF